jgi:hypothetical protein
MDSLLNMIISAIVGAMTLWFLKELLIPTISGIINKAPKVRGTWSYKDTEGGPVVGTVKIRQIGSRIRATATRHQGREGEKTHVEFNYKGVVKGRDVVLVFEIVGSGGFYPGAIVLRLDAFAKKMFGVTNYYSDQDGAVKTLPIFYEKNSS